MRGDTAYFFQSLFNGFTLVGIFYFASLIYKKFKKIENDKTNTNVDLFVALMIILASILAAYGFGGFRG